MDETVKRWWPRGAFYFWFEPDKRQGDGWHFAGDEAACADLEELVGLAKASRFPARFTIPIKMSVSASGQAPAKLIISYDARWQPDHWKISRIEDEVLWEMGPTKFDALLGASADMKRGAVDYVLGGEDEGERVWLWWPPAP